MRQVRLHGLIVLFETGIHEFGAISRDLPQELAITGYGDLQRIGDIGGHIQTLPLSILVV